MIKKIFPFLSVIMLALFVGSCSNEDVMPEIDKGATSRTITFTASMPGEDDPATRVSVAEEADRTIALKWEKNDEIVLLFVQGTVEENATATIVTTDGETGTFTVTLPEGIVGTADYTLYGAYGTAGAPTEGNTIVNLPSTGDLGDKILLHFEKAVTDNAIGSVEFAHKGYVFTAKVEITGGTVSDINLVADSDWAISSSNYQFNLKTGDFTTTAPATNAIALENFAVKDGIATARSWFPATETKLPALKLSVNGTVKTADAKPARIPEVGKAYYLYATWNGTDLVFADKDFNVPVVPGDGTKENPYSVAEAKTVYDGEDATAKKNVWVKGFIVGAMKNQTWEAGGYGTTNTAIADNKNETEKNNVLLVKLPAGELRTELQKADMIGVQVIMRGELGAYFSSPGISELFEYEVLPAGPFFEADKETVEFGSSLELTETIAISTNDTQAWTATSNAGWLTVTPPSGTGSANVTLTAIENTATTARTATVTLTPTGDTSLNPIVVNVTQAAFAPFITVNPASLTFAKEAGSQAVTVTANVAWTATSDVTWLTLTSTEGVITVNATANTDASVRNAAITITGGGVTKTVAVAQAGSAAVPPKPLFPGSDFNDWNTFTSSLNKGPLAIGTHSPEGGRGGSGALLIKGTQGSNASLFEAKVPAGFSATGKTKITFWIKGASTIRALSMNVHTTNTKYKCYNIPKGTTSDVVLEPTGTNDYMGNINTGREWIKVTLDISSIANDINTTSGQNLFSIRVGKTGVYDLLVDDIMIE